MNQVQPPQWIQLLLRRFADQRTLEEIEGDLLEFYPEWIENRGRFRGNLKYFFTVVTLLRPLKRTTIPKINMLASYFIMSWRSILKNKVSSLINLSGLTLGLATCLLILLVVLNEFEYDGQHLKKDSIFLMMKNQKTNDGIFTGQSVPGPLTETLKSNYPQVLHASRVARSYDASIIINNSKFQEAVVYLDPDIFRMMTFPAVKGDPAKALEENSIVLSEKMATKLFGDREAVGQIVVLGGNTLSVGAVVSEIPPTNTLRFQIAVPFKVFEKNNDWLRKWDDNRIQAWVELNSADDLAEFNKQISSLIEQKTKDPNEWVFAYPLTRLHLHNAFSNGKPSGGRIAMVFMLIGFGVFMLLIACVNFMNLATAQSTRRAKEVGVRKTLGAARSSIIFQFLNESFVITFLSLAAAIGLCILVTPPFNTLMHASISFEFHKAIVWILCLSVTLLTALVAGSYPAFVLSRFAPVRVLKRMIDHPGGLSLRRTLVTFQFVISSAVLIGTVILYAQFDHIKKRPIGYEQENLINVSLDSLASARFDVVKNEVSKIAGVRSVTGMGGNILYSAGAITGMDWPGKKTGEDVSVAISYVDYDWSQTMGIEMISGRDFDFHFKSDESACLINQAAVEKMELIKPVGSVVGGHPVIGVFKNFVYDNPSGVVGPMMVVLSRNNIRHLYARIDNNDSWAETISAIRKSLKQTSPDIAFDLRFTSDEYQANFKELSDGGLMVSIFGGMTIFISCLGLFGLSGFIANRRGKEMSIRKVFGADSIRILVTLSTDILKPVVVALIIVIPLSVWIAGMLLEQVVYRVQLRWWMFAQSGAVVLVIALLIVFYHAWRTATESPSATLKSD